MQAYYSISCDEVIISYFNFASPTLSELLNSLMINHNLMTKPVNTSCNGLKLFGYIILYTCQELILIYQTIFLTDLDVYILNIIGQSNLSWASYF